MPAIEEGHKVISSGVLVGDLRRGETMLLGRGETMLLAAFILVASTSSSSTKK